MSLALLLLIATGTPMGATESADARAAAARARTWVVAVDGHDQASGTALRPFATVDRALQAVRPGDIILVRPGRYPGFDVAIAGTEGAPITIRGELATGVIFDGRSDGRRNTVAVLPGAGHVVMEGMTITGSSGSRSAGLLVHGVTSGPISIRDARLTDNDGYGILVEDSRNVSIVGVELDHNQTGVEINQDGTDVLISDSLIHDNDRLIRSTPREVDAHDDSGAIGVSLVRTTGPVLVERNRVWGNRAPSSDYGWDGSAFEIFAASGVTMTDNLAWDNENVLETGTDAGVPCAGNAFVRNVAWGAATAGRARGIILRCGEGMLLANDTLSDLDDYALVMGADSAMFSGSIAGARVVNDLLVQADAGAPLLISTPLPADVSIDHVLLWNERGPIASLGWQGSSSDMLQLQAWTGRLTDSIAARPRFVDRTGHDYRLLPTSPAIDAGIPVLGVTATWTGVAPDLGALETSGLTSVP